MLSAVRPGRGGQLIAKVVVGAGRVAHAWRRGAPVRKELEAPLKKADVLLPFGGEGACLKHGMREPAVEKPPLVRANRMRDAGGDRAARPR